jgi:hypothetical protein
LTEIFLPVLKRGSHILHTHYGKQKPLTQTTLKIFGTLVQASVCGRFQASAANQTGTALFRVVRRRVAVISCGRCGTTCRSMWRYFDNCVGVLVKCVLVFTVFCTVCTVFLYCFLYVYINSHSFCLYWCKDCCHRVTTQLH